MKTANVYLVKHRPGRGRWKTIGTAATRAEALALVIGRGDWRIQERPPPKARPNAGSK